MRSESLQLTPADSVHFLLPDLGGILSPRAVRGWYAQRMPCVKLLLLTLFQSCTGPRQSKTCLAKKAKDGVLVVGRRRQLGSVKSVLFSSCCSTKAAQLSCLLWFLTVFHLLFKTVRTWGQLYQVRGKQEKQTHSFFISFQMQRGAEE